MWKLFFTEDHSDKSQGTTLFLWRRRGRRKKTLRILEWAWNANGKRISKVLQLGYPLISSTYWLLFSKRPFVAILSQSSKWMKSPFREGNYAVFCKLWAWLAAGPSLEILHTTRVRCPTWVCMLRPGHLPFLAALALWCYAPCDCICLLAPQSHSLCN